MAEVNRFLVYGGLAVVVGGALWWSNQDAAPAFKAKPRKPAATASTASADSDLIDVDYTSSFEKPAGKPRDLFLPLVKADDGPKTVAAPAPPPPQDIVRIPANFADGASDWIFTGFAIANGEKMALLENTGTHEAGYVKEGEPWKSSTVQRITPQSIVFLDKKGASQVVLRYDPDLEQKAKNPAAPADAGLHPVDPGSALHGPIGGNLQIQPLGGRGVPVVVGAAPGR